MKISSEIKRDSTFTNPQLMSTGLRKLTIVRHDSRSNKRKIYPFSEGHPQKIEHSCCNLM